MMKIKIWVMLQAENILSDKNTYIKYISKNIFPQVSIYNLQPKNKE
jgi:hypothetical protein